MVEFLGFYIVERGYIDNSYDLEILKFYDNKSSFYLLSHYFYLHAFNRCELSILNFLFSVLMEISIFLL